MTYENIFEAVFLDRPNRFIAHVFLDGHEQVCHVKNTGRCRELLVPGATVYIQKAANPARKTAYDLIAVRKGGLLINMDAAAPNKVFGEWLAAGGPGFVPELIRPECVHGDSRFDFYFEHDGKRAFAEVKGVTLEEDGVVRFPDAPTERGVRHLHTLMRAVEQGHRATVFFVVQMADVLDFSPNDSTDPAFGQALRQAAAAGVQVLAFTCQVTPEEVTMDRQIPVIL